MPVIKDMEDLGELIREVRVANGFSQDDIAQAIGSHQRYMTELERGKSTMQIGKVLEVLALLGITLEPKTISEPKLKTRLNWLAPPIVKKTPGDRVGS